MSIKRIVDSSEVERPVELKKRKLTYPFISEKKMKSHTKRVTDFTTATYPDGQTRIISCSFDDNIRIFNISEGKFEKIITPSKRVYSVHYYEEEEVLMTTDWDGELIIWKLFPKIKIIKKVEISKTNSCLWRITQISSNQFFCCVSFGNHISQGKLFRINFKKKWTSEEIDYPTYDYQKEFLRCIYQLISEKNIILFSGGNDEGGEDFTIKTIDLNNNNKFHRFPKNHIDVVHCLTSFINSKNQEIILSGGGDERIMFWTIKGACLKYIKFDRTVCCFLNDFSRKNIFVASTNVLFFFSIKTEKLEVGLQVKNIHTHFVSSLDWIDKENQNSFISSSYDSSYNIYEMETQGLKLMKIEDKTYEILQKMSDWKIKFKNKNIKFWNIFINEKIKNSKKEETHQKFEQMVSCVDEKILFSIILEKDVQIPLYQLCDYYFFFKIMDLKHCMASINQKIDEIIEFKDIYFLFKEFCLEYENDSIRSWFTTTKSQKLGDFHPSTFNTSFALSLFNKMRNNLNDEIGFQMFEKDKYFPQIFIQIKKYKSTDLIKPIMHKDFEGVKNKKELTSTYYFRLLYENRSSNFNLTLISTDKREFKVHKEILILQFDFFFRLFRFGGLEVTEYEKTGKITLVDLMSSDVVECLIKYAYLGTVEVKNDGINALETIFKIFIFCDQWNELKLMKEVNKEFRKLIDELKDPENMNKSKNKIFKILSKLSSFLDGNDRVLGIIIPKLGYFGFGVNDYAKSFLNQSSKMKDMENELLEKDESEKKLKERILELEKLVGEINEENDKGVGEGQIREREENDEEIKKEQPKRKKRKINKK